MIKVDLNTDQNAKSLVILLLTTILTLLVWPVYMGWSGQTISFGDGINCLQYIARYFSAEADWTNFLFSSELMGGSKLHTTMGIRRLWGVAHLFTDDPVIAYNFYVLVFQILFTFFSVHSIFSLAHYFNFKDSSCFNDNWKISFADLIGPILIFAFLPVLSWRYVAGHILIEYVLMAAICSAALALWEKKFSLTFFCIFSFALFISFPPLGSLFILILLYIIPISLSLFLDLARNPSDKDQSKKYFMISLALILLAVVGQFLTIVPNLIDNAIHLKSEDATRNLEGESLIYSYTVQTLKDMLVSLSLVKELVVTRTDYFLLHETNYPIGPIILSILLFPFRKNKFLFSVLFSLFIFAIIISMDLSPLSDLFLKAIPLLNNFRVPARAFIILIYFFTLFATAVLLYRIKTTPLLKFQFVLFDQNMLSTLLVITFIVTLFTPPVIREILVWIYFITLLLVFCFKRIAITSFAITALILGIVFVSAFKERITIYGPRADEITAHKAAGDKFKELVPQLKNPLYRALINNSRDRNSFNISNYSLFLGLSTIPGYGLPLKKFIKLILEIEQYPYSSNIMTIPMDPNHKSFFALQQLFNVTNYITISDNTSIQNFPPTNGPAWFVPKISPLTDLKTLAALLRKTGAELQPLLKSNLFILQEDLKNSPAQKLPLEQAECASATVTDTSAKFNDYELKIFVNNPTSTCPLVVALNHSKLLKVFDGDRQLETFPAYGTLLGVIVPPGSVSGPRQLLIRAVTDVPRPFFALAYIGWLLSFLALALLCYRLKLYKSTKKAPLAETKATPTAKKQHAKGKKSTKGKNAL
ncbi:MAG: hypothetical protein HQK50_08175 [Oligoflexia bacterium]|nr:hypothetical protein [Oligoflexia bacterium]